MESMFPFGLERPLAFYLIVYLLTWVLHVFLMAYVLAGSLWLAAASLFPGTTALDRTLQPLSRILREWMPFALSGAITAGVAPLLFVQIVYPQPFYTANLLLGSRWMVVIPVLILAFYLLYVLKSKIIHRWSLPVSLGLSVGVAGCFLFVAFCWTANHLLGLDAAQWPSAYATGRVVTSPLAVLLRLATWVAGTIPTLCILAAWQLRGMRSRTDRWSDAPVETDWDAWFQQEHRRLICLSICGLVTALLLAFGYFQTLPDLVRSALIGNAGTPWIAVLVTLVLVHGMLLLRYRKASGFSLRGLIALTVTLSGILLATAALREIIRISQTDLVAATRSAAEASQVSGFGLFLVFTLLNAGLIAWCIQLVHQPPTPHDRGATSTAADHHQRS